MKITIEIEDGKAVVSQDEIVQNKMENDRIKFLVSDLQTLADAIGVHCWGRKIDGGFEVGQLEEGLRIRAARLAGAEKLCEEYRQCLLKVAELVGFGAEVYRGNLEIFLENVSFAINRGSPAGGVEEKPIEWITAGQAVGYSGLNYNQVLEGCRSGMIKAHKRDRKWYMVRESVINWKKMLEAAKKLKFPRSRP